MLEFFSQQTDLAISIILGALTLLGLIANWVFGWLPKSVKWLLGLFGFAIIKKNYLPKETLIVQEFHGFGNPNQIWWHMGKRKDKPMMQVSGSLKVTNISDFNVLIAGAYLKKARAKGSVLVPDANSQYHGEYPIIANTITEITFHFYIQPPFNKEGESFKSDLAIIDNYGNKHWVKNLEFEYR